jgi:hypothetical protein
MTDDRIALFQLVEKSSDVDLLREMIGFAAERLMELEVQDLTGAGYGSGWPCRPSAMWRRRPSLAPLARVRMARAATCTTSAWC